MVVAVAMAAAGCKADDPISGDGDGDGDVDAGPGDVLVPPTLDPVPETTPLDTVALRGTTNGSRVVAQGTGDGSVIASVLPGGAFCVDAALKAGMPTEMLLYAIGGDGRVSEPREVVTTLDPGAPEPSMPTCSASGGPTCDGPEICANGDVDDDCNGLADSCDTACNGCIDDVLEPNDVAVDVSMITSGDHTLQICPCRNDWFAYARTAGQRITVTATFAAGGIDIDLQLFRAGEGGLGMGDQVASSAGTMGTETIDFLVDMDGVYYLRIFSFSGTDTGSYNLSTN